MTRWFEVWIAGSPPQGDAKWIAGCKFPLAGPLALRQLSDFIRLSQCLRHATPNAIASRRVRTSYKSKLKLRICTCSHQLSTSSPAMTKKNKAPGNDKGKRTTIEKRIFINHSEQNATQEKKQRVPEYHGFSPPKQYIFSLAVVKTQYKR